MAPARPAQAAAGSSADQPTDDVRRLGEALVDRAGDVTALARQRTDESGRGLDPTLEESFVRIGEVSTIAVARWMIGESADVAREVGREAWQVFGQLAAQQAAPLNEVTKRCLRWRDSTVEVLREEAARMGCAPEALARARDMVLRSLDVTLVRMCESFEGERQRMQAKLTFLATHDSLTGLPNRALVLDRGEQMLARARRGQTAVVAAVINLDNFKRVNDSLDHHAGDALLRAVAARLSGMLRDTDTLGRLSGDEFIVVVDAITLPASPEVIAERLLHVLEEPFELPGHEDTPLSVTASVGIACGKRSSAEELLRDAHVAMRRAKRDGRNRFVVFASEMQTAVQSRLELEQDLRVALELDQFFLVYQPTFDLRGMRPVGLEALLRWRHPTRGVIPPDQFIPLLEETDLICSVGRWVLEHACQQAAEWKTADRGMGISVNVSGRQLDSDGFIDDVERALDLSGLDPTLLTIEVTETALMRDADATSRRLSAVKALGVRIAIDDFGTGYSSLAHLQQFPVDVLKIDRSFIAAMALDREGETLIRMLVRLGKALALETLAEGIEEGEQLARLRDENCDSGQGFLFARPLEAAAVESFLEQARLARTAGMDAVV